MWLRTFAGGFVGLIRRASVASDISTVPVPDAAWTPYPAYKSLRIQYIVWKFRPDKRSASGFSLLLQRLMSRLMGQQQGD